VLPGEEEAFANFAGAMIADLGPEGVLEHLEVNKLIHAAWRSLRLNHIEAGILTDAILKEQEKRRAALAAGAPAEPAFEEQHQGAIRIGRACVRASPAIFTLARYRVKLDREFYKALEQFRIAYYARVCMWDPHYVANLKRFSPPPDDWKKADRNPNAKRY